MIYAVKYNTGYDYDVTIGYYFSEDEATKKAEEAEKNNPGMGFYVDEIEVI
jgi:hypothetical protein